MAVEIPVYINISGGFNAAAAQIPKEMPKLERAISKNILNIPVYARGIDTVRDALIGTKVSAKDLQQVLKDISYQFERQSKLEADSSRTSAQVKNLAKAYGLVEQRLTGVYNKASSAAMMVTNTINKVQLKLTQLRSQLSTTAPGSDAFNTINYQIKVQEDRLRKLNVQYEQYRILSMKSGNAVVSSFERANNAVSRHNNLLKSVSSLAASYLSIWQLGRFIHNIRETTAEFEMQRVALGGIIQDTERANALFREIKASALRSPFEIKELVSYTKQLSAYRIETDKLFDVTKRLADVSAGLGVDMGRVILAYGQVRAASVLRGQELRQFTEAGIPLVELLAKKFEELGRVGTTTADVFELISKRAVPFSMIEEIFEDMTEAGGTFYKMQERQAETLAGQWANLKDAVSIMYDEIGNTPEVHKAMEDLIGGAKTLMNNWRQIGTMIGIVAQGYIALKIASLFMPRLAYNTALAEKALAALERAEALEAAQAEKSNIIRGLTIRNLKAYATELGKAAAAQTAFGRGFHQLSAWFLGGGWISLAITAVTVLVGWLVSARKRANELNNELNKIGSEGALSLNRSVSNFNRLADAAVNAADGSQEQIKAIEELKRTYGDLIPTEELQVEKLRSLQGSYESLTEAIKQKVNMQIREQKINAIQDSYSSKLTNETKRAQRILMQYGLDKDQIRAVLDEIGEVVDDGMLDMNSRIEDKAETFRDIIKRMTGIVVDFNYGFQDSAGNWQRVYDQSGKALKSLNNIVSIYSDLNVKTDEVNNDMSSLIGTMGEYADAWKNLEGEMKNVSVSEEQFGKKGSFSYNEELLRQRVQKMASAITDAFKDTGIDISEAFKVPERIDFKFLSVAAEQAAASGNWGIDSFVKKIQKKYDDLVPSDAYVTVIKTKFQEIAAGVGLSMDDVQGFMMKGDADVRKYTKGIKDSLQEMQDKLAQMHQQNEASKKYSIVPPISDETITKQDALVKFLQELLKFLDGYAKHNKGGRDTRLSQLKSDISELTNAYKKFEELKKYKTEDEALIDINKLFPQLEGKIPSLDNVVSELEKRLEQVKKDLARSPKSKTLLDMKRALETEISNLKFDDLKNGIEKQLQRISDEIKRSEAAQNFYKDIFDLTGDERLATSLSVEVYGGIGDEFKDRLQKQLNTVLSNINADTNMSKAFADQDFGYILDHLSEIPEKWHKEIKDLADAQQKFSIEQIKTWLKELKEAKTYAEQRVQLAQTTAARIAEINASNLKPEEKTELIGRYTRREAEETAKLQYEAFKNSPMYVELFANLDTASASMLQNMRNNLVVLKDEWRNLSPQELKELQSRLNELDRQLANRNPFQALVDSLKKYRDMNKERSRERAESDAINADRNLQIQKGMLEEAIQQFEIVKQKHKEEDQEYQDAEANVRVQQTLTDIAEEQAEAAQHTANSYRDAAQQIASAADAAQNFMSQLSPAVDSIKQIVETFGSDETTQTFNTVTEGVMKTVNGVTKVAGGIARAIANPADITAYVDVIAGLGDVIAGTFGTHNQLLLDEANRKIEEQNKVLEQLERSYDKLDNAMERSFGSDYLYNYNEQMDILLAKQEAYRKQAEAQAVVAEKSSKKADRDAAAEEVNRLNDEAAKAEQEMEERVRNMQEFFAGTSLTSAAEEFAKAWLDAYREFGNTSEAIKEKMQDMIENIIVKSSLAKVAETVLKPFYDAIEEAARSQTLIEDVPSLISMLQGKTAELNNSLNAMGQILTANGVQLRGTVGSLSGISRDIASASEESILALAAGINTQNFYMSYVPTISADLRQIVDLMSIGTGQAVTTTAPPEGPVMPSVQEMVYDHLPNIDRNMAELLRLVSNVVKPNGTSAPYYVATKM